MYKNLTLLSLFFRAVPCSPNSLCIEEDQPQNVVKNSQFTFRIQDLYQARFWYISIVACKRNLSTCNWEFVEKFPNLEYDIFVVNGNPESKLHKSIFKYEFSSDKQDLYQVYLVVMLIYTILTPLQIHAAIKQEHPITKMLAGGLIAQFVALLCINIHFTLVAFTGKCRLFDYVSKRYQKVPKLSKNGSKWIFFIYRRGNQRLCSLRRNSRNHFRVHFHAHFAPFGHGLGLNASTTNL